MQDDLLAELEELEQEDLEKDLLEVGEPSNIIDTDPLEDLPEPRMLNRISTCLHCCIVG